MWQCACGWLFSFFFFFLVVVTLRPPLPSIFLWQRRRQVLFVLDIVFTILFSLEMLCKIVTYGLVGHYRAYLTSGWNRLDAAIVVVSIVNLALGRGSDLGALKVRLPRVGCRMDGRAPPCCWFSASTRRLPLPVLRSRVTTRFLFACARLCLGPFPASRRFERCVRCVRCGRSHGTRACGLWSTRSSSQFPPWATSSWFVCSSGSSLASWASR